VVGGIVRRGMCYTLAELPQINDFSIFATLTFDLSVDHVTLRPLKGNLSLIG